MDVLLALAVLGRFASLVQADFLAFHFAGIAGDVPGLAQRTAQFFVVFDQGAGQAQADGACLAGDTAALTVALISNLSAISSFSSG